MPSKVQICNRALTTYLGQRRITSLDEESPAAEQCNIHYDDTLSGLLEVHWWTFAGSRRVLAALTNDRPDEWGYRYAMPDQIHGIRWVNDPRAARALLAVDQAPDTPREIEGLSIYSDVPNAVCAFTMLADDPSIYPQYFSDALSAALAANMAQPLTEDRIRSEGAQRIAEQKLDLAVVLDRRQTPPEKDGVPNYLQVRGVQ